MKKLIIVLFLVLSLTVVYAGTIPSGYEQSDVREDLKLSVTIDNAVYFGVTDKAINSSIVPTKSYSQVDLKFDSNTHTYKMDTLYFYVLSFVSYPIKVTLTSTKMTLYTKTGKDSAGKAIYSENSSQTLELDYTASVKNTKKDNVNAAEDCKSITSITGEATNTLVSETGSGYMDPRVMEWQFELALSSKNQTYELDSDNIYAATFTMTVSTK